MDAKQKIIIGAHLSQCSSGGFANRDSIIQCAADNIDLIGSLPDATERSAAAMKAMGIDPAFAPQQSTYDEASHSLRCPGGHTLVYLRQSQERENVYRQYQARGEDCCQCAFRLQCCRRNPERGRMVSLLQREQPMWPRFGPKWSSPRLVKSTNGAGKWRSFPTPGFKEKIGLRKFRVRGLAKVATELIWACLSYNVMRWIRLRWLPAKMGMAA